MATIYLNKCRKCGNEFSQNIDACPKCGTTVSSANNQIIIIMVVIVGLIGWWIFSPSKESTAGLAAKQIAAEQKAYNDKKYSRVFTGEQALKKIMRDPDSLVFERVRYMDDESVCYEYRAKNGFGGMSKGEAVLSEKGFITNDDKGFDPIWSEKCASKSGEEISL